MKWKTIALIFMVLFVLETIAVSSVFYLGIKEYDKKYTCNNICMTKDSDSFLYDDVNKICKCWQNDEVIYQEVMR